ncbi:hypothetical protein MMC29_002472, partial [Sticta canariensis]|nr:hypothetical protein [Sticta canariensis]
MPPVPDALKPAASDPAGFAPTPTEIFAPAGFDRAGSAPAGFAPTLTDKLAPAGFNRAGFAPASKHNFAPMAYPAQRQLDAVLKGSEVPRENKRGRKSLPLGAPKAKYTKRVVGEPRAPFKPTRAHKSRSELTIADFPGPADSTS